MTGGGEQGWRADEIDTASARPSGVYDAWLSGKDGYAVDRDLAEAITAAHPQVADTARANRAFLRRAVRHAVTAAGLRQLLDVGCGIPAAGDACSTARALQPTVRVVAVDRDPIAVTRARALVAGTDPQRTAAVYGDLRHPAAILGDPEVRRVLDLSRPVLLVLGAVLHFLDDRDDPAACLRTLTAALAPGSVLILSHATGDLAPAQAAAAVETYNDGAGARITLRTRGQVAALLDGWQLLDPGLVPVDAWRPDPWEHPGAGRAWGYGAVAVKPAPARHAAAESALFTRIFGFPPTRAGEARTGYD